MNIFEFSGVTRTQMAGIFGALLLIIGCFAPIFFLTVLGKTITVSFFTLGFAVVGSALTLVGLLCAGLYLKNRTAEAQGAAAAVFLVLLVFFFSAVTGTKGIHDMAGILAPASVLFSIDYAWLVLFAGTLLLIGAPYLKQPVPAK